MRLDKYLSSLGYGTKEVVSKYIKDGFIKVNNEVILERSYQINENDIVLVDESINPYINNIYIMINKPSGYVSANSDLLYPPITSLLDIKYQNITFSTLGRLDVDSLGLMILTNDTKLIKKFHNPNIRLSKTYLVTFTGSLEYVNLDNFKDGIILEDGYKCKPSEIRIINSNQIEITIYEGKFHQIKRMFNSLNLKVIELKRISIGNIKLLNLDEGKYRELTIDEINYLKNI